MMQWDINKGWSDIDTATAAYFSNPSTPVRSRIDQQVDSATQKSVDSATKGLAPH